MCKVPVDDSRGGVPVERVAEVDEALDGGDVDVVDGGEVEDYGAEGRLLLSVGGGVFRAGVAPEAVLRFVSPAGEGELGGGI